MIMTDLEEKAFEYAATDKSIANASWIQCVAKEAFLVGAAYALGNQWRDAEKEKPADEEYVLIHSENGVEPAVWNEHFNCWDDAEGDDCMYSAEDVDAWLEIPDYQPKGE